MENLAFGLEITAIGMGLVFGLLALLWLALAVAARLGLVFTPELPPLHEVEREGMGGVRSVVEGPGAGELGPEALAAIAIAVATHAAARRRQAAPEMRSVRPGARLHASRWLATGRGKQVRGWTPRR